MAIRFLFHIFFNPLGSPQVIFHHIDENGTINRPFSRCITSGRQNPDWRNRKIFAARRWSWRRPSQEGNFLGIRFGLPFSSKQLPTDTWSGLWVLLWKWTPNPSMWLSEPSYWPMLQVNTWQEWRHKNANYALPAQEIGCGFVSLNLLILCKGSLGINRCHFGDLKLNIEMDRQLWVPHKSWSRENGALQVVPGSHLLGRQVRSLAHLTPGERLIARVGHLSHFFQIL